MCERMNEFFCRHQWSIGWAWALLPTGTFFPSAPQRQQMLWPGTSLKEGRDGHMNSHKGSPPGVAPRVTPFPGGADLFLYRRGRRSQLVFPLSSFCPTAQQSLFTRTFASLKCTHWLPPLNVNDPKDVVGPGWSPSRFRWLWSCLSSPMALLLSTRNPHIQRKQEAGKGLGWG